ncbi:hypothetical protein NW759_016851 [Fusarium solani]|nr:hypothetical protein NW759_016851 [Fusarium solani]
MASETVAEINRAVIYTKPTTTETKIVELPVPQPGPGQVLVRLQYSGVCHTDYAFCMGTFPGAPPAQEGQIGGHEGVGTVVSQGPGILTPAVGSKVGIKFSADACLSCKECLEGSETSCRETQISGYTVPGTFQQFCVAAARYVTPIPENMDLAAAAPLMCSGVSAYAALKRAGLRNGDWVVISGAGGGLGHLGIQYAKVLGGRVLAIDSSDKEELCKKLGAEFFLDFRKYDSDQSLAETVLSITAGGARIALMCASSARAYAQGMSWLRVRGILACLGIPEGDGMLAVNLTQMVNGERSIVATKSGNRLEAVECLEIAARCGIKTEYQLFRLDDLTDVFNIMRDGKIIGRAVLDLQ